MRREEPAPIVADEELLRLRHEVASLRLALQAERQRSAESLAVQERLDMALDGADLGLWDWNVATGTVDYDRRWLEMLGYGQTEIEPTLRSWECLVHPDDLIWVRDALKAHLQGNAGPLEMEHRLRHRDGSWVWVLSRGKTCE